MRLQRFVGDNFRNFAKFEMNPGAGVNVIFGENGSGKTSLLEAIYLFGFGRSFRPGGFRPLIKESQERFTLYAEGEIDDVHAKHRFGMARDRQGGSQLRINGNDNVRLADLALNFPVQLFTPESVEVVAGSPSVRRQLIDWGVFHVEHAFFEIWSNYNKVLKQRNRLLKESKSNYSAAQDKYWQQQLAHFGEQITELRLRYLNDLRKYFATTAHTFLPDVTLDISLKPGWDKTKSLTEALSISLDADRKFGHTTVGPHKADLQILANGVSAREHLSRGQVKVVVASLKISQAQLLEGRSNKRCIIIVDDLTSELDHKNQQKFCSLLEDSNNQIFLSSVSLEGLAKNFKEKPAMFHVEQGILKRHIEN